MTYFHQVDIVGRGSETQLQVGENSIQIPGQRLRNAKYLS